MTLDLIEIKPRLNIKKVIIITIAILLIIAIVFVSSFFGIRFYNNKLSIIHGFNINKLQDGIILFPRLL